MRLYFLILIACLCFTGCGKKDFTQPENPPSIIGKWEWFKTFGFFGGIATPQTTGKEWYLTFNPDSTFTQTGTLFPVNNGVYYITPDSLYMKYANENFKRGYKRNFMGSDSLKLDSGSFVDGPVFYFEKK